MTIHTFTCSHCHETKNHESDSTTGYGYDQSRNKVCFACCGKRDEWDLLSTGKATLYLSKSDEIDESDMGIYKHLKWHVSNWPGTLKIKCSTPRKGNHNIARNRYDVWFRFKGSEFHGVQYGDNTQICHVRKIKK